MYTGHRKRISLGLIFFFFYSFMICNGQIENEISTKIVLFPLKTAIISSIIDSSINKYYIEEGDSFKKGELIVELDAIKYKPVYAKAKASLAEFEASYLFANNNFKQNTILFKKGTLGRLELGKSELDYKVALTKVKMALANLQISKIDLDSCKINAPFQGRLVSKIINEHEFVRNGQAIMEIIDDSFLLAVMHIPSNNITKIHKGMELKFKIDETGSIHEGRIYEIAPVIDPGSRSLEVKSIIENKNRKLNSGMSGVLMENLK